MRVQPATVICPKCGFPQEERLDCRKCGVVFAKYYALHPPGSEADPGAQDAPPPQQQPVESLPEEITDLRHSIQELNRRLSDVGFERAERTQLRRDLKALEQGLRDDLSIVQSRLQRLEEQAAKPAPPAVSPEDIRQLKDALLEESFLPLQKRLEGIEARVDELPKATTPAIDLSVLEELPALERRLSESEKEITRLAEVRAAENPEGLAKVAREIDELRTSLQNVSVRYSEIGELKKNNLVLLSRVESLQLQLERTKEDPARAASNRIPEITTEIHALRAEVRQALKRLEELEAISPASARELRAVVAKMAGSLKSGAEQGDRMQASFESMIKEGLARVSGIPEQVARVEQRNQSLEQCLGEMCETGNETSRKVADISATILSLLSEQEKIRTELGVCEEKIASVLSRPRPPVEEDVHVIRQTLDSLNNYLNSVAPPSGRH